MSFEINWDLLNDGVASKELASFLNSHLSSASLQQKPSFVGPISISNLSFGSQPPEIHVTDITEPFAEFYLEDVYPGGGGGGVGGGGGGNRTHLYNNKYYGSNNSSSSSRSSTASASNSHLANPESVLSWGGISNNRPVATIPLVMNTMNSSPTRIMTGLALSNPQLPSSFEPHHTAATLATIPVQRSYSSPFTGATTSQYIGTGRISESDSNESIFRNMLHQAQLLRKPNDLQVELWIKFNGNMRMTVTTELIINQPTPAFMVLPLTLTLTGFSLEANAVIAYLGDRVNFCFKEPENGQR